MRIEKTNNNRIAKWFHQRTFFFRLLVTALLVACIPLISISLAFISNEENKSEKLLAEQLSSTSVVVAKQFDSFVDAALTVKYKIQIDSQLFENRISKSVQSEIDAIERIQLLSSSMLYVSDVALYISGNDNAVYNANGKFTADVYAKYYFNDDSITLTEALTSSSKSHFTNWGLFGNYLVFVSPIVMGNSTVVSRTSFFLISPSVLHDSLKTALTNDYHLAAIYDSNSQIIYYNDNCPRDLQNKHHNDIQLLEGSDRQLYYVKSTLSLKSYRIVLFANQNELQQQFEQITLSVRTLAFANILLCIILVMFFISLNYNSIARVLRRIRVNETELSDEYNEFEYILNAYAGQVDARSKLELQLHEHNYIVVDHIFESLLNGQEISNEKLILLNMKSQAYFIMCTNAVETKNIESYIEENTIGGKFYSIEMYADRLLAIICCCEEPVTETRQNIINLMQSKIESVNFRFGISRIYYQLNHSNIAYREASRALVHPSDGNIIYADDVLDDENAFSEDNFKQFSRISYLLQTGDESALSYATESFDKIISSNKSLPSKKFDCFHLIDFYRRASDNAGLVLDKNILSDIFCKTDIAETKSDFCSFLTSILSHQSAQQNKLIDTSYSHISRLINRNYTDPSFCLNNIADCLNVTPNTASRIINNVLGVNFRKYLNDKRIEYAKELLILTTHSVKHISELVGFTSSSYFISLFKKSEDITPIDFRKRYLEKRDKRE